MDHTGQFVGPPDQPDAYVLVRELGHGGEGSVWEAHRAGSSMKVAVKLLDADKLDELGPRWKRAADLLKALPDEPTLCRVHDCFAGPVPHNQWERPRGDHALYMVMDFVDGPTYDAWLLSNPADIRPLRDVAQGLDVMHRNGVRHGDVKPRNIKVRGNGAGATLVDMSLSRALHAGPLTLFSFSRNYADPMLFDGAPSDDLADLYSFAATIYQALTGNEPGEPEDMADALTTAGFGHEPLLGALERDRDTRRRRSGYQPGQMHEWFTTLEGLLAADAADHTGEDADEPGAGRQSDDGGATTYHDRARTTPTELHARASAPTVIATGSLARRRGDLLEPVVQRAFDVVLDDYAFVWLIVLSVVLGGIVGGILTFV